eukprot:scaffold101924_cov58-Phaeocystis_antarctica.AAC.7
MRGLAAALAAKAAESRSNCATGRPARASEAAMPRPMLPAPTKPTVGRCECRLRSCHRALRDRRRVRAASMPRAIAPAQVSG